MKNRTDSFVQSKGCPTPEKAKFFSNEDAETFLRSLPSQKKLRCYGCQCGSFHLTKQKERFQPRRYF